MTYLSNNTGTSTFPNCSKGSRKRDLIIIVHGLFENKNSPLISQARDFFSAHGFYVYLCNFSPSILRNAYGTTLLDQAHYLKSLFKANRHKYTNIYVIAHSIGAIPALLSGGHNDADALILWEPSLHPHDVLKSARYDKSEDLYYYADFPKYFITSRVVNEARTIPPITQLAKRCKTPTAIICAKNAGEKHGKRYYKILRNPLIFELVARGGHDFKNNMGRKKLFGATLKAFEHKQGTRML